MSLDKFVIFAIVVMFISIIVKLFYKQINRISDYVLFIIAFGTFCYGFSSTNYDKDTIICIIASIFLGTIMVSRIVAKDKSEEENTKDKNK